MFAIAPATNDASPMAAARGEGRGETPLEDAAPAAEAAAEAEGIGLREGGGCCLDEGAERRTGAESEELPPTPPPPEMHRGLLRPGWRFCAFRGNTHNLARYLPEISAPAVGTEVEEGEAAAPPLPPPTSTAPTSRKDTDFPLKNNV